MKIRWARVALEPSLWIPVVDSRQWERPGGRETLGMSQQEPDIDSKGLWSSRTKLNSHLRESEGLCPHNWHPTRVGSMSLHGPGSRSCSSRASTSLYLRWSTGSWAPCPHPAFTLSASLLPLLHHSTTWSVTGSQALGHTGFPGHSLLLWIFVWRLLFREDPVGSHSLTCSRLLFLTSSTWDPTHLPAFISWLLECNSQVLWAMPDTQVTLDKHSPDDRVSRPPQPPCSESLCWQLLLSCDRMLATVSPFHNWATWEFRGQVVY